MFKMLLVEDEPVTLEGIKSSINWSMMDIYICGEATNGLEAIELIEDLKPDIILCDIRMPKMDGISFVNYIQPHYPYIKVIFLSAYSDKEFLKSAIHLNAIDYIYKPFELSELIQAIEKAKAACIQHYTIKNTAYDNDIALNLIQKSWINPGSLENIPIELDNPLITVIICSNVNNEIKSGGELITVNHYLPYFQQALSHIFNGNYVISPISIGYIIHANVNNEYKLDKEILKQLDGLFDIIKDSSRFLTIGVSNPVSSYEHLKISYMQANEAIKSAFLIGYGKLISYNSLNTTQFVPSRDLETMFFMQIENNNIATAIDFLEEYISYMCNCRSEDIPAIKDELTKIAFKLNQKIQTCDHIQQQYITETIIYASDIIDIKGYLLQLLDQIQNNINNLDDKGRIIFDVERFILENYDENLSIDEIAKHVYLTPTYLCHLYKKNTGRTLNQFIREVKMNKSRYLLTNTNLTIGEISEKIGYNNQNYFTKTFTKYFGITPTAFRNKHLW
ncbi:response regulator [Xylanivirga thermophila]|uniref:response regulator n=1 Tax=Xylanivirga thermophila TaxID=2496273 RepID=UPI0013ED5247|nr:response regulator [Xylanivirga thermophila]